MATKLTPEERFARAKTALHELQVECNEIIRGKYVGQDRGAAYKRAQGRVNAVCRTVAPLMRRINGKYRYPTDVVKRAEAIENQADFLYRKAWKTHHP